MLVLKVKVISLPYIFQVLYVLCFTWTRYQVSVYRTIGPLVSCSTEHTFDLAHHEASYLSCLFNVRGTTVSSVGRVPVS